MQLIKVVTRFVFAAILCFAVAAPAVAQGIRIVRDAETEDTIRQMTAPLLQAAGITPSSVSIHLVNDKSLNAFVANGLNIYIHTGLLMTAENANQVIGVIAHETGHITGGHLSRLKDAVDQGSATSLIATLLGAAVAVGTGRGDVGAAVFAGGQTVAQRNFLTFTRSQENSADQAALKLLDATGQSAKGLYEFMEVLQGQELLISNNQDPYVRTHPLSSDRLRAYEAHMKRSQYTDVTTAPEVETAYQRVRAKLRGYFNPPHQTLRDYPLGENGQEARYARAFAYSRIPEPQKALDELDNLLTVAPDDPFYLELKSQVLFESGNVEAAVPPFRRAVEQRPNSALLRGEFGRVLLESKEPGALNEAVDQLKLSLSRDRNAPFVWRNLGIAYGRLGDIGRSSLALAEEAALRGKTSEVSFHAGRAAEMFPVGSPERLQAEDLLLAVKNKNN